VALNEFDHFFNSNSTMDQRDIRRKITTIRYADDYVVISNSKQILERIYSIMERYFSKIGLQFNASKTKIMERSKGFNFLGFHFVKYPRSYLKVTPSKSSLRKVKGSIKKLLDRNMQAKTDAIVYRMNQIIRGWCMYYRYCNVHWLFSILDHLMYRWEWK